MHFVHALSTPAKLDPLSGPQTFTIGCLFHDTPFPGSTSSSCMPKKRSLNPSVINLDFQFSDEGFSGISWQVALGFVLLSHIFHFTLSYFI